MSYARINDRSDVYVVKDVDGMFTCFHADATTTTRTRSEQDMIQHLREHIDAGHKVPDKTLGRLWREWQSR